MVINFFFISENRLTEHKFALKTRIPKLQMFIRYGYWNRKWSSNMVTGTIFVVDESLLPAVAHDGYNGDD